MLTVKYYVCKLLGPILYELHTSIERLSIKIFYKQLEYWARLNRDEGK